MHTETTLPAMVAFIKRRLVKTADMGSQSFPALAETPERFNDTSWFWTDDNAKAAELLAEPAQYDADPGYADAAIDFVLRMSEGAVIQRRCGPPELRVLSDDPRAFRVETAFFIIEGDLSLGVVRHSLRFNDGRTVTAAQHTGNMVSVRQGRGLMRREATVDVETNIDTFGVEATPDRVELWHSSRIALPANRWRRQAAKPLGHVRYTYTVGRDWPAVTVRVALQLDPGVAVDACTLTTALDQLGSVPPLVYRSLGVRAGGVDRGWARAAGYGDHARQQSRVAQARAAVRDAARRGQCRARRACGI